jgi:major membrane immunogen (membrane-anchored lipoprotein)
MEMNKGSYKSVFAVFDEKSDLKVAVSTLKDAGFRKSDMSVLLKDEHLSREFAQDEGIQVLEDSAIDGSDGVVSGLMSMGIPEFEAKRFDSIIQNGGMLISVHVDDEDWSKTAKALLRDCGTRDISIATENSGEWQFLSDDPSASNGYYRAPHYNSTVDLDRQ